MNASTTRFVSTAAAIAAVAALLSGPAQAQQPLSRAEVNQQTLAAMKAGTIVSGEGLPQGAEATAVSTKSREERKADTMQARRNGEILPGGVALYKSNMSQQTATARSTKTRAERKAETVQAIKDHQTMQPGEAA